MSGKRRRPSLPPAAPDPTPTPLDLVETEEAKKKARGRKKGRPSTILAGRLVSEHGKMLLGE